MFFMVVWKYIHNNNEVDEVVDRSEALNLWLWCVLKLVMWVCMPALYFIKIMTTCDKHNFETLNTLIIQSFLTFSYSWMPIVWFINDVSWMCFVATLCFLVEAFCTAELRKLFPVPALVVRGCSGRAVDFGVFNYVAAMSVCTAQNLFGFWSRYSWTVFIVCLVLIALHNVIPPIIMSREEKVFAMSSPDSDIVDEDDLT
ncbi:hypothetical protein RND81_02G087600 [Saponaria officinalis]|uniref:Uncharacterized protein n=1 Tax=Saponaria officinalis TaxID=3572 RepID=A0AAW1MLL5_SAPOF